MRSTAFSPFAAHPRWLDPRSLCNAAVLIGFAGLVTLRGPFSPGTMGALLAAAGTALALRERRLDAGDVRIAALFAVLPLYYIANLALTGWDATQLDKPGRMLVGLGIYLAVSRVGLDARYLRRGVLLGCFAAAALAAWQVHHLGAERADGALNAIPFGNNALLLGVLALAGWITAPPAVRRTALPLVAAAAALYASLASGSRGGWVTIPLLAWLLSLGAPRLSPRLRLAVGLAGLALLALAAAIPAINERTLGELDSLRRQWGATPAEAAGATLSSIGTRLHLYRLGIEAFVAHPFVGIGFANLHDWLAAGAAAGTVNPAVLHYTHLHSAPVDMAARGGVLGLLALLGCVAGFLRFFHRGLAGEDADSRYFALAGLLATAAAAAFSLTNVFFPAIAGTNILVMTLAVPAGALAHRRRQQAGQATGART